MEAAQKDSSQNTSSKLHCVNLNVTSLRRKTGKNKPDMWYPYTTL